jgi:histidine triad (HIT) family protein
MDCIFCKIVSGQIPAKKVYETQSSLAFLDAFPLTRGHVLVVPKAHHVTIQQMSKTENADLFESVRLISNKIERIAPSSLLAIHNGKESGQEIPHVHVHIIPRNSKDGVGPIHSMFTNRPNLSDKEFNEMVEILKKD